MTRRKISRKRALAGRASIIGALEYQAWRHDPTGDIQDYMSHIYVRGYKDALCAVRAAGGDIPAAVGPIR